MTAIRESLKSCCERRGLKSVLSEWHPSKNGDLTPETVGYGSRKTVWWRCEKGHEWQCRISARTGAGSGCPYCAGRLPVPGETDLASRYPRIAAEWHPSKNGDLTPDKVLPGERRRVWWRCEKGHEWRAAVYSRTAGSGCPYCSGRKVLKGFNDLASTHPGIAAEWHPALNGSLTPEMVTAGSHKKVWWLCPEGHEWQAQIFARARGNRCPVCSGKKVSPGENDLAALFPQIAAEWDSAGNAPLTPSLVQPNSSRSVWWLCPLGHSYRSSVASRTRGTGCPYCAGRKVLKGFNDLATVNPEVAAEWHPALNGSLTPDMVTAGSGRNVWWRCPLGHVWKAGIYTRTRKKRSGCPVCAGTVSHRNLK